MKKIKKFHYKNELIVQLGKDYYSSLPLNGSFIIIEGRKLFKTGTVALRKIGFLLPRSSRLSKHLNGQHLHSVDLADRYVSTRSLQLAA